MYTACANFLMNFLLLTLHRPFRVWRGILSSLNKNYVIALLSSFLISTPSPLHKIIIRVKIKVCLSVKIRSV